MDFEERWKAKRAYYQGHKGTVAKALEDIQLDRDGDLAGMRQDIILGVMAYMLVDIAQSLAWIADKE